jgi:hypothetical protein
MYFEVKITNIMILRFHVVRYIKEQIIHCTIAEITNIHHDFDIF